MLDRNFETAFTSNTRPRPSTSGVKSFSDNALSDNASPSEIGEVYAFRDVHVVSAHRAFHRNKNCVGPGYTKPSREANNSAFFFSALPTLGKGSKMPASISKMSISSRNRHRPLQSSNAMTAFLSFHSVPSSRKKSSTTALWASRSALKPRAPPQFFPRYKRALEAARRQPTLRKAVL